MRILLDENLNWRLCRELPGHEVISVQKNGWAHADDGTLLTRAAEEFDVFITMDGNIEYQQNFSRLPLILIALRALSNDLKTTAPLMPAVLAALPNLQPGTLTVIG